MAAGGFSVHLHHYVYCIRTCSCYARPPVIGWWLSNTIRYIRPISRWRRSSTRAASRQCPSVIGQSFDPRRYPKRAICHEDARIHAIYCPTIVRTRASVLYIHIYRIHNIVVLIIIYAGKLYYNCADKNEENGDPGYTIPGNGPSEKSPRVFVIIVFVICRSVSIRPSKRFPYQSDDNVT